MNDINNMSVMNRVAGVSRLEVRFEVPGVESKRVFANGRMQVKVWVFVEAVDEDGELVPLPYYPALITTRLIQYHDGHRLARDVYTNQPLSGWNCSSEENRYTHEVPGSVVPGTGGGATGTPLEFWVSSSTAGQLQIAAEVQLNGKTYRSNNTENPDGRKINKSIVILAEKSPAYSHDQFNWRQERIEGPYTGVDMFRYYLGLYPGGRQIRLLEWQTRQYEASNKYVLKFFYTGMILSKLRPPRSVSGVMVPGAIGKTEFLGVPVEANHRSGELTALKGVIAHTYTGEEARLETFMFSVLDEFGNTHQLSLRIDIETDEFLLQRG